jgi:hypothetical protein
VVKREKPNMQLRCQPLNASAFTACSKTPTEQPFVSLPSSAGDTFHRSTEFGRKMSRRRFLQLAAAAVGSTLLKACSDASSSSTPAPPSASTTGTTSGSEADASTVGPQACAKAGKGKGAYKGVATAHVKNGEVTAPTDYQCGLGNDAITVTADGKPVKK